MPHVANGIESPTWRQSWSPRRIVYASVVVAVATAALYLGYQTYRLARQSEKLGEQSILESTLTLAKSKVRSIENYIIASDHRVIDPIVSALPDHDMNDQMNLWMQIADSSTPSVRAVIVVDMDEHALAHAVRATPKDARAFLKFFMREPYRELKRAMQKPDLPLGELQHLHLPQGYLFSYIFVSTPKGIIAVVAHQDLGYLKREVLPAALCEQVSEKIELSVQNRALCTDRASLKLFNVVDEHNRVLVGRSLHRLRDYVVGIGFPTTLYGWRLQVAPNQATKLQAVGRSQRTTSLASWVLAWCVVLMGMGLLVYAVIQERKVVTLKNEFIANVSHELKTPLSVIRMFSEMIASHRVPDATKTSQYASMILSETERLSRLIDNVLDFAAIEKGLPHYEMNERDLCSVIRKSIDAVQFRAERDQIVITTEGLDAQTYATYDEQAMMLALINLLDNAIKYGERSPIQVILTQRDDEIDIAVRDQGPGIATADLKKIFQRFYRPQGSRHVRGSGIGLSLVKSIAEAHGGRAWARAMARGAEVGITIPKPRHQPAKRIDPCPKTSAIAATENGGRTAL